MQPHQGRTTSSPTTPPALWALLSPIVFLALVLTGCANTDIGYLVQRSAGNFNTAGAFAGIAFLVVASVLVNALVTLSEKRLLRGKPHNLTRAAAP